MENLAKELETRNRVIASIFRISNLLTKQVGIDEVLKAILQSAKTDLGFSAACMFQVNSRRDFLECRMITGFSRERELKSYEEPFSLSRHDCIETRVVKTGATIYFEDAYNDPQATQIDRKLTRNLGRGRIVYAPLTVKGEIIGCMGVNRPLQDPPISASEIEAFSIFANQASIIIENSRSSEQLVAERNLRENVLESSPNGIIGIDRNGRVIALNKAAARILSLKHDRSLNSRIEELPAGIRIDFLARMEPGAAGRCTREFELADAQGARLCLEVTASVLKDTTGHVDGTMFLIQDVTERKIMAEQVQRMGKLATIGQLAAGLSHEIRNPLMGIEAALDLVGGTLRPDDPHKGLLDKSIEEIDRVDRIIGELLNLSGVRDISLQPTRINDVAAKAADLLAGLCRKHRIEAVLELPEDIPLTDIDPEKMREALINVCLNSVQAMDEGGTLRISTSVFEHDLYGMSRGGVKVSIEDTGGGIPPGLLEKVFDPFFTTRPDGTGLGLYNCHRIVEAHGGVIFIENIQPAGTRVSIVLPRTGSRPANVQDTCN